MDRITTGLILLVALGSPLSADAHPLSSDPYSAMLSMGAAGFDAGAEVQRSALTTLARGAHERIARDNRLLVDEAARSVLVAQVGGLDPVAGAFYASRRYLPAFVTSEGLTPAGDALLGVLEGASRHGLEPDRFGAAALRASAGFAPGAVADDDDLADAVDDRFVIALIDQLVRQGADITSPAAVLAAADRVGHAGFRAWYQRTRDRERARLSGVTGDMLALELAMTDAAIEWAWVMRYDNPAQRPGASREWHTPPTAAAMRRTVTPALAAAMVTALAVPADQLASSLEGLAPQTTHYGRLVDGLSRYREMQASGGWEPVGDLGALQPGDTGADVVRLRSRLAAEGYLPAGRSADYDDDVRSAVEAYQWAHALEPTGIVDNALLAAFDVPVHQRIAAIVLSLERMRESHIGNDADATLVRINIPSFTVEVWQGRELAGSFVAVVGAATGPNPTPEFSDTLDYMELNPFWYAPARLGRGSMAPGPNNPMGQVKIIFSNPYAVYMHDTNHRELFANTRRALSSGCVRVRDPLSLASLLWALDQHIDIDEARARIDEGVASGTTERLHFASAFGVHLEYVVAQAAEDGTVRFFEDIYGREADALREMTSRADVRDAPTH